MKGPSDILRDILRVLVLATRSSWARRLACRSCFNLANNSDAAVILSSVPLRILDSTDGVLSTDDKEGDAVSAVGEGDGGLSEGEVGAPIVIVPPLFRGGRTDFHSFCPSSTEMLTEEEEEGGVEGDVVAVALLAEVEDADPLVAGFPSSGWWKFK